MLILIKKEVGFKCDYCDYRNKDKRNTNSHMRTHQSVKDSRYECDKCHKKMRFQHTVHKDIIKRAVQYPKGLSNLVL